MADIQRGVSNLSVDNMEQVLETANLLKTECKQFIILVSLVCGDSQGERIRMGCLFYCYDFWSSFAILHFPLLVFSNLHLLREEALYLFKKFSVILEILNCRC